MRISAKGKTMAIELYNTLHKPLKIKKKIKRLTRKLGKSPVVGYVTHLYSDTFQYELTFKDENGKEVLVDFDEHRRETEIKFYSSNGKIQLVFSWDETLQIWLTKCGVNHGVQMGLRPSHVWEAAKLWVK